MNVKNNSVNDPPFNIKIIGHNTHLFENAVLSIIIKHCPIFKKNSTTTKKSNKGKYLSFTITIPTEDQTQINAIYQDLNDCKYVIMTL